MVLQKSTYWVSFFVMSHKGLWVLLVLSWCSSLCVHSLPEPARSVFKFWLLTIEFSQSGKNGKNTDESLTCHEGFPGIDIHFQESDTVADRGVDKFTLPGFRVVLECGAQRFQKTSENARPLRVSGFGSNMEENVTAEIIRRVDPLSLLKRHHTEFQRQLK